MNRSTQPASGLATVISGTLQSGTSSRPALYERSGLMTISQSIDAYMAAYEGRDESRAQRMAWWQAKIGHLTLLEVDEDHIFYAIEELSSKKPRYYAGKDVDGNSIYKAKNKPYTTAT
jgi:hypothetical protein